MACSSGLSMVSLGGEVFLTASIKVSWINPAPLCPVAYETIRFFSYYSSPIHSLVSCPVSHTKFHSTVSISPLEFFPVCLTCISWVPLGFLKLQVAMGEATSFLGFGRWGAKGKFLKWLL